MAKTITQTIDTKLCPGLFSSDTIKLRPSETLNDLYEELLDDCMKNGGQLEKPDSEAFIALQSWAFGKMTDREAYNKLDRLDYIMWEIV